MRLARGLPSVLHAQRSGESAEFPTKHAHGEREWGEEEREMKQQEEELTKYMAEEDDDDFLTWYKL